MDGARKLSIEIKREDLIQHGLEALQSAGSDHICKVCIESGNSCCIGCQFLQDGLGCQSRNTSCTAWLCDLQRFFLHQIGLLDEWEKLWDQVPGQGFRKDNSPDTIKLKSLLNLENLDSEIGKVVAEKVEAFVREGGNIEKLDRKLSLAFDR
jgi:hypothetical protein